MEIGSTGGTLAVTDGDYAGLSLVVPPGALDGPTTVSIARGFATAVPGYLPAGRPAVLGPAGLTFRLPVRLTLPFSPQGGEAVVLRQGTDGRIVELGPADSDGLGLVAVDTVTLSTVWAAERAFDGLATAGFLPLDDGNVWEFEGGLTVTVVTSTTEPNIRGTLVWRLLFETADQNLGFYLMPSPDGSIEVVGELSTAGVGDFQQLHDPTTFLPRQVTLGQVAEAGYEYTDYEPFGAITSIGDGTAVTGLRTAKPSMIDTPAGMFGDLLEWEWNGVFTRADGAVRTLALTVTFARDTGPVAVDVFDAGWLLTGGTVSGQPIGS
jgi:hypothetical protein